MKKYQVTFTVQVYDEGQAKTGANRVAKHYDVKEPKSVAAALKQVLRLSANRHASGSGSIIPLGAVGVVFPGSDVPKVSLLPKEG